MMMMLAAMILLLSVGIIVITAWDCSGQRITASDL